MKKTGRSNTDIHTFIKAGLVILLVVYLTLLYTADNAKNIPIEQITASMESDETITSLNKEERTDLKHYYQVDERGQAATLLESAQSHLSSQKNIFEGYGTDQMALLNNALVGKKGNYVYYMCGADAASWRSAFLALI